jgi:hypothetical protein
VREFELGSSVRLTASFANAAGAATDPTTVTFQFGLRSVNPPPDPTATSAVFGVDGAVVKDATGQFHFDFTPATAGIYTTRVVGTGTVAAAAVGAIRVKPSPFA